MLHGPAIPTVAPRSHEPPGFAPLSSGSSPSKSPAVAPQTAPPSRTRRILLALVTPTILLVAMFGGHGFWTWQAERRLERFVANLRASGEPVSLSEIVPPPIPDQHNAAIDIRIAAETIVSDFDESGQSMFGLAPLGLPLTERELSIIRPTLQANAAAIEKVRTAMARPGLDWTSASASIGRFSTSSWGGRGMGFFRQRGLTQLLYSAALVAHTDGDQRAALERVEELLFLARCAAQRPTVRAQRGSMVMYEIAMSALAEILPDLKVGPGPRDATPQEVKAVIARLLEDHGIGGSMAQCLRIERARQLDVLLAPGGSRRGDGSVLDPAPWGEPLPMPSPGFSRMGRFVSRPVYLNRVREALEQLTLGISCFQARDLRDFLQTFNDGAGPVEGDQSGAARDAETIGDVSDGGYTRQLSNTIQQAGRTHFISLAQRRTVALALAISLYRAQHDGHLPAANLSALVPDYIAAIPGDPLSTSGESVVYVPGEGRPRVYSVGEDGIDDGGWPAEPYVARAEDLRMTDWVIDLDRQPRPVPPGPDQQRDLPFRRSRS